MQLFDNFFYICQNLHQNYYMDFQDSMAPWMGRTMKLMDLYFHDTFKKHKFDLSKNQWIILKVLSKEDGKAQNDLAFITNRDKTSLTRLISSMEKKNLVARIPSKTDKRVNHIYLTKYGKNVLENTIPIVKKLIDEMQEPLTDKEVANTIAILKRVQENILTKIEVA